MFGTSKTERRASFKDKGGNIIQSNYVESASINDFSSVLTHLRNNHGILQATKNSRGVFGRKSPLKRTSNKATRQGNGCLLFLEIQFSLLMKSSWMTQIVLLNLWKLNNKRMEEKAETPYEKITESKYMKASFIPPKFPQLSDLT